jgi:N-acyl-D-aspartate/D-glutamate deacylase
MPGFIDLHTHCNSPFRLSRRLREQAPTLPSFKGNWNYLLQGVTTVNTGNCGEGFDGLQAGTHSKGLVHRIQPILKTGILSFDDIIHQGPHPLGQLSGNIGQHPVFDLSDR